MPRSRWGGINRHAVIWRDISCRKHFGYDLVEISVPIYYNDPEPLILEPNQHYSTPQNRPNSTPPTEPIQKQPNPPYPTHHTPPTHHTHPTYHPEGTMHPCLGPSTTTTTTTTTQHTLPTPPTAQKVLCTFAFAPRPPPPPPPRPPHLPPSKELCTFAFAPRPPPPTTTPPNHPPTHPFGTSAFYHRCICSIVNKQQQQQHQLVFSI